MATHLKNLSEYSQINVADVSHRRFGIVVAEWNSEVTEILLKGALETLQKYGAQSENIVIKRVPGSFELPLASQKLAQIPTIDAVIAIGCLIQGETRHFNFIAQAVAEGIMQVGLKCNKPVVFGVLTTNNLEQALERAGGKYGNKGEEAAITAIKMINI